MTNVDNRPNAAAASKPAVTGSMADLLRQRVFSVLLIATVVSNIGTWMESTSASWLMTSLNPDPFIVSMVQVAASLPMFLFAIPAGALADTIDRRRLLVVMQLIIAVTASGFGVLVWLGSATPNVVLGFVFFMASAAALILPAWQSIVPQLVPRTLLQPAIALNSAGVNVSRAVGPALAGMMIAAWGIAGPFWVNGLTTLGVVAALIWWKPPQQELNRTIPRERFALAIVAGFRYVRHDPRLRTTLIRACGFFIFASAYWALLPLISRNQIVGGPALYGVLLGAIGFGAVATTFALGKLKARLSSEHLVDLGVCGTSLALLLFALAHNAAVAIAGSIIAGASWIIVLSTLNVSAQLALPDWVRARGLSIYGSVMFGSLTVGSIIWGKLASVVGLPEACGIAALGGVAMIPILWRWKLPESAALDLRPSMSWADPLISDDVGHDRGPVLVIVEYQIKPEDLAAFLTAIEPLAGARRRDGAFTWNVFEDPAQKGRVIETFMIGTWLEHLRQHQRLTRADRELQEVVNRFQAEGEPKVLHLLALS